MFEVNLNVRLNVDSRMKTWFGGFGNFKF